MITRPAITRPAITRPAITRPAITRPAITRPAITRLLRAVTVTLLCGIALLAGADPAFAHARLQSSDPADGSSTATGPAQVSLTFNEPMQPGFATITVIGPYGKPYQSGNLTANGGTVSVGVAPLGPAGRYEIAYRVVSEDGHPVTGSVAFTLTAPGPAAAAPPTPAASAASAASPAAPAPSPVAAAPAPAASTSADTGSPVWPLIVGGIVLIAVGAFAALRLGRS
jgi:methionine-rich copper-binding protein CopC